MPNARVFTDHSFSEAKFPFSRQMNDISLCLLLYIWRMDVWVLFRLVIIAAKVTRMKHFPAFSARNATNVCGMYLLSKSVLEDRYVATSWPYFGQWGNTSAMGRLYILAARQTSTPVGLTSVSGGILLPWVAYTF